MTIDEAGTRTRTGDLSIAVSSPEGHVFGGPVGGVLVAATTVQVLLFRVLVTFAPHDYFSRACHARQWILVLVREQNDFAFIYIYYTLIPGCFVW